MLRQYPILLVLALQGIQAAVNEPCYGAGGRAGVCVTTAKCSAAGGTTINNACRADGPDIKCCTKPSCAASPGNCRWKSDCAGSTSGQQCPGPDAFTCCHSAATGFGGYRAPSLPTVGACKQVAVDGARKVLAQFPGRIHDFGCTRDCACNSRPTSDHCCGKAIDFMCSDAGGAATVSGLDIAEWVMRNRAALNVKYVIWGQRIWEPPGDAVKPWAEWKTMEDRDSITQNHWDHVHVSFN